MTFSGTGWSYNKKCGKFLEGAQLKGKKYFKYLSFFHEIRLKNKLPMNKFFCQSLKHKIRLASFHIMLISHRQINISNSFKNQFIIIFMLYFKKVLIGHFTIYYTLYPIQNENDHKTDKKVKTFYQLPLTKMLRKTNCNQLSVCQVFVDFTCKGYVVQCEQNFFQYV